MKLFLLTVLSVLLLSLPCQSADILPVLNAQRAQLGLYPMAQNPQYQQYAEMVAQTRAQYGISGHLPRNRFSNITRFRPRGTTEGVGMRSIRDPYGYRMLTCEQANRRYRYAGAAVAVGRNGTYYALIIGPGH